MNTDTTLQQPSHQKMLFNPPLIIMDIEDIIEEFSKYGQVEVFSEDLVLTFLMTGKGLDYAKLFLKINEVLSIYAESKGYTHVEVIKNTEKLILIVLKP